MAPQFSGIGSAMSSEGLSAVADRLGVHTAEIWALLTVETRGCGFLRDRRPLILFERHIFSRETGGRYDGSAPEVSQPTWGGYGAAVEHQYDRLAQAISLDRTAALRSASWGIGQVMGFHADRVGYNDVEAFVKAMADSEDAQLAVMAAEIASSRLDGALRTHDWPTFARGYNGPLYARNQYDIRLAAAYGKFRMGLLPDLTIRQAQICLIYLGFDPGPVDGVIGRKTRSALAEWEQSEGIASNGDPDEATLTRLRNAAFAGVAAPARKSTPRRRSVRSRKRN
jgi:hypothetical protein